MSIISAATAALGNHGHRQVKKPPALGSCTNDELLGEIERRLDCQALGAEQVADAAGYDDVDLGALESAADWWRRGDKREALHYLEIALGRDFDGLGEIKPEDLR